MRIQALILAIISLMVAAGCNPPGSSSRSKKQTGTPLAKKQAAPRRPTKTKRKKTTRRRLGLSALPTEQRVLPRVPEPGQSGSPRDTNTTGSDNITNADLVAQKAIALVGASVKYGPTLVVWFFDQSASARGLRSEVARAANGFYGQAAVGAETAKEDQQADPRLLTAVVAFGSKVHFLLGEPTDNRQAIVDAINAVPDDPSGREMGFSAVKEALARYLDFRKQGREVLFIITTDEGGDDAGQVEEVLTGPRKYGLPIYVIGPPAPLGRASGVNQAAEAPKDRQRGRVYVRQGPESRYAERISLEMPTNSMTSFDVENIDSGFGPFGWEWLCRASGGKYLTVRSASMQMSLNQGFAFSDQPTVKKPEDGYPYDSTAMRTRAPDFVSEPAYQQILSSNGACMALHEAAKLPAVPTMLNPVQEFAVRNEAELKRTLDTAQTEAARLVPEIDRIYQTLVRGEKDRKTLTKKRWQASYDLAMGRVLAAKVRVEGYNVMLAALKRGRKFKNEGSTTWVLEPADNMDEAGGKYRTMAQRASEYLKRVVQEHPGTPWAQIADWELKASIGWQWNER